MEENVIYQGDCFELVNHLDNSSVDLFVTSPPYADLRKYGGKVTPLHPDQYAEWALPLFRDMFNKLKPSGSIIWNIDDKCYKGGRHPYIFELVYKVCNNTPCRMYDYYIWSKQSSIPSCGPKRINHTTEFILHFCKDPKQTAWFMDRVREPYAENSLTRYKSSITAYEEDDEGFRREGKKNIRKVNPLGKIPSNVMRFQTNQVTRGNKHPAPFNIELPTWFIEALTTEDSLVVDTFMGSGTTAIACQILNRRWIGFELNEEYVDYANTRIHDTFTKPDGTAYKEFF